MVVFGLPAIIVVVETVVLEDATTKAWRLALTGKVTCTLVWITFTEKIGIVASQTIKSLIDG
jgi:hypothetical protein